MCPVLVCDVRRLPLQAAVCEVWFEGLHPAVPLGGTLGPRAQKETDQLVRIPVWVTGVELGLRPAWFTDSK